MLKVDIVGKPLATVPDVIGADSPIYPQLNAFIRRGVA